MVSTSNNGVAVLTPNEALSPLNVAAFSAQTPRLNTEIAVAGYSYEGVLDSHSVTDETLSDLRGLRGEEYLNRMALTALAGDAGGQFWINWWCVGHVASSTIDWPTIAC